MANLNKVMLIGNLTRDPDVRYTPKGTAVTEIGLAVNRNFTTDDGERREDTTFVDVTVWGRQAEVIGQYMKKGRPIFIEGRLQLDTWDDKETGAKRSKLRVVAESFQFLGGREDNQQGSDGGGGSGYQQPAAAPQSHQTAPQQSQRPAATPQPQTQQAPPQAAAAPDFDAEDDDIPF